MDFADFIRTVIRSADTLGQVEPEEGAAQSPALPERVWYIEDVKQLVGASETASTKRNSPRKRAA